MYNPISCEFFDQLEVVIQRKIPSTVIYLEDGKQRSAKGLVQTLEVIDGKEYLLLESQQKIRLDLVITFNGKRHRKDKIEASLDKT